jgi:hypothetical protein
MKNDKLASKIQKREEVMKQIGRLMNETSKEDPKCYMDIP